MKSYLIIFKFQVPPGGLDVILNHALHLSLKLSDKCTKNKLD